ncbi:5-formyltetrahydrofolate cyclo-ligase [Leptothoe spongobia]|uniref:5-formyltetrahydrofolate cyclo-ligase n=1 Tax=Leptothoe spongobia TAU-MAC 1115 TaxID=1967444 RepID=A0A947DGL9_9CYAN|nr:5-formyltetrahydrofolate cyclo-ligase [Leptothoe spongobia]MBT9316565.1 5-formyltetrahydrofolate cyclo-ligase [Leptothoe spongobia TAU-MAC 1115]
MSTLTWSGRHIAKDLLRQRVWSTLKHHNAVSRDPVGHIPDFIGADVAANCLAKTEIWQQAQVIKCNPDSPHTAVRLRALADGKILYMAVPRLSCEKCFVELKAADLEAKAVMLREAASMRGAMVHGRLVAFEEMQAIDLVVVGCVAVAANGGRMGKGAGFADLELAMLRECELISETTPIVTTVHDLQVVPASELPMQDHDWGLDLVVTPTRCLVTDNIHSKPTGLDWDRIQPDQTTNIPILGAWTKQRI